MRFAAAVVAFAVATAVVSHAVTLPEFLVQLRDPNLAGGPLFAWLLHTFGYAFVLAICAVLTAGTVLLVSWRARVRGATDWHAALAAILVALCLVGRMGVSLDPIGWVCAAAFCLLLDRDDMRSAINAIAIVAIWSVLQGGATIGALIAVIALIGAFADARCFDLRVKQKALVAAGATLLGALQLHALPWHAYGAHALYLDSLAAGAQRDRIWNGGLSVPELGFSALIIVAGWYGVRRRGRSADALVFFALLVLSLTDARNLPYFGIFAAPLVVDALASYYVGERTFPMGSVRHYFITFMAAAATFVATLTVSEPKVLIWPQPPGEPAALFDRLAAARGEHRLLCVSPRWCDGVHAIFARITPVIDDRAGLASARAHRLEYNVVNAAGPWQRELRRGGVNAVIAGKNDDVAALLSSTGWRVVAHDGSRVLLLPGDIR